jgi:class 3 adenylate cyclase
MTADSASQFSASVEPNGPVGSALQRVGKSSRRFGIKAELLVAFGAMTVMTIVASLIAWLAFSEVDHAVSRITVSTVPSISRAHAIAAEVAEITATAPVLLASATQDGRAQARRALAVTEVKLQNLMREIASTEVDQDALTELRTLQNDIAANLSELDVVVEHRLALRAKIDDALARLASTHRQVLETLEPLVDDAVFDTIVNSEEITKVSTERMTRLVDVGVAKAQRLLEIKAEASYTAGLLAQVSTISDPDLIGPLYEQFVASSDSITRGLDALADTPEKARLSRQVRDLLVHVRGPDSVFEVRRRELGPQGETEGQSRSTTASALATSVNVAHEQLLLTLATVVDDAIFDVVIASEQAVRESEIAITGLVDDGVENLRALLTVRAEANLAAGLLNEASGVSDRLLIEPLRERFIAARSRITRLLRKQLAGRDIGALDQATFTLIGFGSEAGNIFDLRHAELKQMAAAKKAIRDGSEIATRLGAVTRGLVDGAQEASASDGFRAQDAIGSGQILLLIVIAATVSGAISIIVFYVTPRVVQPLVDMTNALVRLAAGDTTVELPAQDRRDEVGDMALAFKVFRDTAQARSNLSRYFSPKLVEELAQRDEPLGPVRRQNVAVLFADIVGFTQISENQSPEMTMMLLREFHRRMEEQVFLHNGVMEKFIGDALLATFGVPDPGEYDAVDALRCARGMQDTLAQWNTARVEVDEQPVRIGIGLNFGPAVLGDIGSERNMAFAVIGDTTNTASRLEGLTRDLACDIVVSGAFVDAVRRQAGNDDQSLLAGFRQGGSHVLRGRSNKVPVWTFTAADSRPPISENKPR